MFVRLTFLGFDPGYYNQNQIAYFGKQIHKEKPQYQTEVRIVGFETPFYALESVKDINKQLKMKGTD